MIRPRCGSPLPGRPSPAASSLARPRRVALAPAPPAGPPPRGAPPPAAGAQAGAAPPAAELDWARLLVRAGRSGEAIPHLEHLILTYPSSAVVPEARRELERAKGAIPKS